MRILIADDNPLIRRGVAEILSSEPGWAVCGEAADGNEALQMCRALTPDLVLLDISMPGCSGMEAARHLRRELQAVKILIMSHHDPFQILPSVLQAGADGCMDKARIATDLVSTIQTLAEIRIPGNAI